MSSDKLFLSSKTKYSYLLKLLSFFKVPLLYATGAKIVVFSENETTIYIPLKRKNKNHLGSMYFGALAMGAELSVALMAIKETRESSKNISFIFKDFKAEFLKRADAGTYFSCLEAAGVKALVKMAEKDNKRVDQKFSGFAFTDKRTKEPVLKYELTLSLKNHS